MTKSLKDSHSIYEKLYWWFLIALMFFAIYGFWIDFSPSKFTKEKYNIYAWIVAAVLWLHACYYDIKKGISISKNPFILIFFYPILVMFLYGIFIYSIPAVITISTGKNFQTISKIDKKYSMKFVKNCNNPIYTTDIYHDFYKYELCSNSTFVNKIKINGYLDMVGKETKYGRKIESYQIKN